MFMKELLKYFCIFLCVLYFPLESKNLYAQKQSASDLIKTAETHINRQEYEQARNTLEAALKIKEKFPIAYRLLGVVEGKLGNFEASTLAYKRLFDLQGDFSKAAYFEAGQALSLIYI